MSEKQTEALRLADELDAMFGATEIDERVTAELRRLYAENERLNNALDEPCIDYKATIEGVLVTEPTGGEA